MKGKEAEGSGRITRKSGPSKARTIVPAALAADGESVGSSGVSSRKQGMEKPHKAALIKQVRGGKETAIGLTCTPQTCTGGRERNVEKRDNIKSSKAMLMHCEFPRTESLLKGNCAEGSHSCVCIDPLLLGYHKTYPKSIF